MCKCCPPAKVFLLWLMSCPIGCDGGTWIIIKSREESLAWLWQAWWLRMTHCSLFFKTNSDFRNTYQIT
jgi:hypothetical protein